MNVVHTLRFLNTGVNSQSRHLVAPQNTVHVIGQATPPLYFNCSIELVGSLDFLIWHKSKTRHSTDRVSIGRARKGEAFELSTAVEGEYDAERTNLIVTNANFDDAGSYLCENVFNPKTEKYAEAIIFGK